ncbi:response regulator transcription factor [Pseudoclavibacter sp. AY1H1]|uniref:response regulator n=1 Tax=Pseudoclavibacter sp. AY1H1 TaxID=2080584 RepID=UPI000CE90AAD|nr:response regulator transcription factor [Pseudoclavibacter sp. AY1H1]PPF33778.1 DNA-binding response regulator [Pseudoclavibacter sp. AY1H1]
MSEKIRVVLVDDHQLVRMGFKLILESEPDIVVVGEATDGREAVSVVAELRPDLVCMDVQMPVLDGIAATREIMQLGGAVPRVLMLTTFRDEAAVRDSLRAGASGFVLKNSPPETLVEAVRVVHSGDALLDPQVTRGVIAGMLQDPAEGAPSQPADALQAVPVSQSAAEHPTLASLTDREGEVLALIAEGLSNADIAQRLFVSEATVKTHVSNLLAKIGVRDRIHAVIFAYNVGVVAPVE